jgi:hypothetical protein
LIHAQELLVKAVLFANPDNASNYLHHHALVIMIADQDTLATMVNAFKIHHLNLNVVATMIADPERNVKTANVSNNHNAAVITTVHTEKNAETVNAEIGEILLLNDVHFTLLL